MLPDSSIFRRPVTLDSGVLLGRRNWELLAAARLGYYRGHWSSWISEEVARVRTELIALRAVRDQADVPETRRRLKASRERVNAYCDYCSRVLVLVDYTAGLLGEDLTWLRDPDDVPIMATAVAAGTPGVLVTDNRRDFPLRESRGGVLFLGAADFLDALCRTYPAAEQDIRSCLGG